VLSIAPEDAVFVRMHNRILQYAMNTPKSTLITSAGVLRRQPDNSQSADSLKIVGRRQGSKNAQHPFHCFGKHELVSFDA
jgi:hypothetical protein